ncbi:MAG TPA: GDSL-type esterase/lipase family protein [Burkholderiaceae bacterium]|jgi:acyl-CoA thioesterase-1|nr:GDSL-type esterase/lipase family protein [Burkholderiaceae bacterium]
MKRRALLAALALAAAGCGRKKPTARALPRDSVVLALGDSITHGTGAEPAAAYPAQLAALTGWRVVNGGVPGDTAAQALERLPALLAEHRPALVIVSLGGNDFLRRVAPAETDTALRSVVARTREAGAQVLLVAVPQPSLTAAIGAGLSDHPLYARLADELALPMHAGGWARVLGDAQLRSDQIHANAEGYRVFAEGLAATLRERQFLEP